MVWSYPHPLDSAPPLAGYLASPTTARREEDEPVYDHPRDPYHRVDVRASSCHVVVRHHGEVVAESRRYPLPEGLASGQHHLLPEKIDVEVDGERLRSDASGCSERGYACPNSQAFSRSNPCQTSLVGTHWP